MMAIFIGELQVVGKTGASAGPAQARLVQARLAQARPVVVARQPTDPWSMQISG
jgi:hypothetical protein